MDDMLLSSDSFAELQVIAGEAINLFESRGFKLRRWVANSLAKDILMTVPHCDLAPSVGEIDLAAESLPNSKALDSTWDTENDKLLNRCRRFTEASTKREMTSQIASQFDPLGIAAPFL